MDRKQLRKINSILKEFKKIRVVIYVWGIGEDFYQIYSNTCLKDISVVLIDSDKNKQKYLIWDNQDIFSEEYIPLCDPQEIILITDIQNTDAIVDRLFTLGYKGRIVSLCNL